MIDLVTRIEIDKCKSIRLFVSNAISRCCWDHMFTRMDV